MDENIEQIEDNDRFWLYIGCVVFVIISTIMIVKHSEDEKFAPIQQQLDEEASQMNIRVLN